mmetsp:Transcript_7596/g.27054  ORF Transcript_7596/g.27054 Transcript_7596/m.27054 type:complete len:265 (-) Transcript_7596:857-1651(-)
MTVWVDAGCTTGDLSGGPIRVAGTGRRDMRRGRPARSATCVCAGCVDNSLARAMPPRCWPRTGCRACSSLPPSSTLSPTDSTRRFFLVSVTGAPSTSDFDSTAVAGGNRSSSVTKDGTNVTGVFSTGRARMSWIARTASFDSPAPPTGPLGINALISCKRSSSCRARSEAWRKARSLCAVDRAVSKPCRASCLQLRSPHQKSRRGSCATSRCASSSACRLKTSLQPVAGQAHVECCFARCFSSDDACLNTSPHTPHLTPARWSD